MAEGECVYCGVPVTEPVCDACREDGGDEWLRVASVEELGVVEDELPEEPA